MLYVSFADRTKSHNRVLCKLNSGIRHSTLHGERFARRWTGIQCRGFEACARRGDGIYSRCICEFSLLNPSNLHFHIRSIVLKCKTRQLHGGAVTGLVLLLKLIIGRKYEIHLIQPKTWDFFHLYYPKRGIFFTFTMQKISVLFC